MTLANRVRDECQRLMQEYLTAHPAVAERLRDGDTGVRYSMYLDVLGYVTRKFPVWGDWRDKELQRGEIMDHVRDLCRIQREAD